MSGYRTIPADAALLLARIVPVALQASYLKRVFLRIRNLKQTEDWSRIKEKEKEMKEEEKVLILRQWQIWTTSDRTFDKRTCEAIGV